MIAMTTVVYPQGPIPRDDVKEINLPVTYKDSTTNFGDTGPSKKLMNISTILLADEYFMFLFCRLGQIFKLLNYVCWPTRGPFGQPDRLL